MEISMKTKLFIRALCIAAVLALSVCSAFGADISRNLIKLADDTAVYSDPTLQDTYGVLSAGSVVYASEFLPSSGNAVLEIVFCHESLIHTAYIPLMTAVRPMTDAETDEYAAKAPTEGIACRPGVVLLNVPFVSAHPAETGFEVLPSDEGADQSAASETAVSAEAADPVSAGSSFEVLDDAEPEGVEAAQPESAFVPGFVSIPEDTMAFSDPAMQRTLGVLPQGTAVYASASIPENGVFEIAFCLDYIIRTAYIPGAETVPLTEEEAAVYAEKAIDGIVFRPGVAFLNMTLQDGKIVAAATPEITAPASFDESASRTENVPAAQPAENEPAPEKTAEEDELFPKDPADGVAPLPFGKRYILNPEDPVPKGTSISGVVMPVYTAGNAEGIIDFAVLNNGVYVVVESILFSQKVTNGSKTVSLSASYTCKYDTYVMIRYIATSTCSFSMRTDRRTELYYFNDTNGVFLMEPQKVPGYRIDGRIR